MDRWPPTNSPCEEVGAEISEMAAWLSLGRLRPDHFRLLLMVLEAEKVRRFGFTLSAQPTPEGRCQFELRSAKDDQLCARLDFDSGSQELKAENLSG